jgi:2-oxoglutarate dehydrogenase E2 component (dihydrolipoamide succinyltransferase)
MALVEIKVPSPGESISEVRIARWLVKDGDVVGKDQVLGEIDSDKATLEVIAEEAGKVKLLAAADAEVKVGDVVVTIDTSVKPEPKPKEQVQAQVQEAKKPAPASVPVPASSAHATPVAKAMLEEKGLSPEKVKGSGPKGRITKSDVAAYVAGGVKADAIAERLGRHTQREPPEDDHPPQEGGRAPGEREEPDGHAHHLQRGGHERGDRPA